MCRCSRKGAAIAATAIHVVLRHSLEHQIIICAFCSLPDMVSKSRWCTLLIHHSLPYMFWRLTASQAAGDRAVGAESVLYSTYP